MSTATTRGHRDLSEALSEGSGRGLLEVYQGWTDAASAGDLEEVY